MHSVKHRRLESKSFDRVEITDEDAVLQRVAELGGHAMDTTQAPSVANVIRQKKPTAGGHLYLVVKGR